MNINEKLREQILEKIKDFRLIDDNFMTVFFDGELACTEYLLRTIIGNNSLKVTSVKSQYDIANLQGRSVRLDVRAEDDSGKLYDIEVQRSDKGALPKRARYNSALIDANLLNAGDNFDKLPETYVIFITEHDVFKGEKALYHADRRIEELNYAPLNDGTHIIYVNCAYKDETTAIGKLIHDFWCKQYTEMHNRDFANRARFLKENDKGRQNMCQAVQELIDQQNEIVTKQVTKAVSEEMVKSLIKEGTLSLEAIAKVTKVSLDEVKRLQAEIQAE